MKMKKEFSLILAGVAMFIFSLFAAQAFAAGDAGCGLGSVIISKNSKGLQLLALTTNGSFLSQAFGITSGTSGCSSSGIVSTEKEVQYYVEVNQDDLVQQMAMGQGEKLDTLASLNGCKSYESKLAFGEMARSQFTQIVPSAKVPAQDLIQNMKAQMAENQEVSELCHLALAPSETSAVQ